MRAQVVLLQGDQILMVRLQRGERTFWVLPGGAIEENETAEEAAVREVQEETGLVVVVKGLLFIDQPRTAGEVDIRSPRYTYLVERVSGALQAAQQEVAEVAWMPLDAAGYDAATRDTMCLVRKSLASR